MVTATSLSLRSHPEPAPARAAGRVSLVVGGVAAVGVWAAPTTPLFVASWVLLFTWACVRAGSARRGRPARLPVPVMLAGLLTTGLALWGAPSRPLAALGVAVAGGALPFHLWQEDLRRRLSRQEFLLLLLSQPGLVWLHRFMGAHPAVREGALARALLLAFVASAVLHAGLGLVRKEPARALSAITLSQASLLMAGTFAGPTGWTGARMLLVGTVAGSAVLLSIIHELRDTYGVDRLAPDHGLAEVAPDLNRLFIAMGWLFVGLPGGITFFAEDLLFHALLEHSTAATVGLLFASGLNAVAFYRVYTGLFCGPTRPELRDAALARSPASGRRRVFLTAVTALVILGGLAPSLFVG
jgi:NADH:ubiquinone oxidoreductase subunit 2 (subunit N)